MKLLDKHIDKRIAAYQHDLVRMHYQEVDTVYKNIQGFRHDFKNHLQVLKTLAERQDVETIKKYLDNLESHLLSLDTSIKSGNRMADAIINSKVALAKSHQIDVVVEAAVPVSLSIPDVELCIIIGNLFDNAIEASILCPIGQRKIRVYLVMKHTQLYMSFTNVTNDGKQPKIKGRFLTTKGNNRGLGLSRIDATVSRLGGYLNRNSEAGAFVTEVLLPQTNTSSLDEMDSSLK